MPQLHVDTGVIGRNTEAVAGLLRGRGLDLVGVTKGCLGEPRVGAAMLAGGAVALADTRDHNLRCLRGALPEAALHRIYLPPVCAPFELGDVTYISSPSGATAVAETPALGSGRRRQVVIVVESGDLREGVPIEGLIALAEMVVHDPRLELVGVATNYACFKGGPAGIRESLGTVARAARALRAAGMPVHRVSGGNSSVLALLRPDDPGESAHHHAGRGSSEAEGIPAEVTELRCGEALLLGQDALFHRPLPGCACACRLRAEVLEEYTKSPSSKGERRLVLGLGSQDLGSGAVRFVEPGLRELGRSGDYLVVESGAGGPRAGIGGVIEMIPSYEALVAAWTSPYVELCLC